MLDIKKLDKLDLSFIKQRLKYFHKWSDEKIEEYEYYYKIFLLLKDKYWLFRPNDDVDEYWHEHILYTKKYAEDCDNFFGKFLHHWPTFDVELLKTVSQDNYNAIKKEFPEFSEEQILKITKLWEI